MPQADTSLFQVSVKWAGKLFENIPVDMSSTPATFKAQLFSLTGVAPVRQKILVKGGVLKDDTDWSTLKLKQGQVLMMMGTADEAALKEPQEKITFIEDMSTAQANVASAIPAGLARMPELQQSLLRYSGTIGQNTDKNIVASMRDLFKLLNTSGQPVPPLVFLQTMRLAFPQFAQQSRNQGYSQQDAEECFTALVGSLDRALMVNAGENSSFVEEHMSGLMESTLKCDEAPDEPATVTMDKFSRVSCHISSTTNYMNQGLSEGKIEKTSPTLNRLAVYTKTSRIAKLPQYMVVSFVRFFWKQEQQIKAKIMRAVKYPLELDMFPFCSATLQESLKPCREVLLKQQDAQSENVKKRKTDGSKSVGEVSSMTAAEFKALDVPTKESLVGKVGESLLKNPAANIHGFYDLVAVLTHVGRSADSGHYMGWVRKDDSEDDWWKFDDDKVTAVKSEDILKLAGGGDWHMAYLLVYKTKSVV